MNRYCQIGSVNYWTKQKFLNNYKWTRLCLKMPIKSVSSHIGHHTSYHKHLISLFDYFKELFYGNIKIQWRHRSIWLRHLIANNRHLPLFRLYILEEFTKAAITYSTVITVEFPKRHLFTHIIFCCTPLLTYKQQNIVLTSSVYDDNEK